MAWVVGIGIFLLLLFTFPRLMIGLIIVCALAIGGFGLWTKLEDEERDRLHAAVKLTISYDTERCSSDYPLLIRFVNGSQYVVEKVTFGIEGTRTGYSEPLYDSGYIGYSSDKIIASDEVWASCWTVPRQAYGASEQRIATNPPEALAWAIKNSRPTFQNH